MRSLIAASVLSERTLLISADSVRDQAMAESRAVTGLNPNLRGAASVSLFPSGRVSFAMPRTSSSTART